VLEISVTKRRALVSRHRHSITPSTPFKRLPVWVSRADIVAYLKLSPTDAQALIDRVEKISKYELQMRPLHNLVSE
jgi:hypothetical protein